MTRAQTRFARKLKKFILAEPKKINMSFFHFNLGEFARNHPDHALNISVEPGCETVGCIGGSACFLVHGKNWPMMDSEYEGAKALGLTENQASALFYFPFDRPGQVSKYDWDLYKDARKALKRKTPGTQEYANVVADALQAAIDEYGFKGRL